MKVHVLGDNYKTEKQWEKEGYKLKKDAIGVWMWDNWYFAGSRKYYTKDEVRKMTEKQIKSERLKRSRKAYEKRKQKALKAEKDAYFRDSLISNIYSAMRLQQTRLCLVSVPESSINLYYKVPNFLNLEVGEKVVVPFGNSIKNGVLIEFCEFSVLHSISVDVLLKLREIISKEKYNNDESENIFNI